MLNVSRLGLILAALLLLLAEAPAKVSPKGPNAESLRAAELAFAASVREKNPAHFAAAVADDAIFISGNDVLRGKAAIVKGWASLFTADAPPMDWHPEFAEVQDGGGLGLTRGPWKIDGKDKDGKPSPRSGVFNSIWRHETNGEWKVIFDAGCPPCPCAK
ncbi:MAG: nuclear transport factor 2 family protein [Acidobacteriota bacterium]